MPKFIEILLLSSVHGHFVYSRCMWPGLWKCQNFKEIFIVSVGVGKKNSRNTRQEDEGMFKGTMFILLILKNNNPDYKMWKSVPQKQGVD